ncbi:hypothetical protein NKJ81_30550 [Mesorhizobium sp. M0018]|uniref:hypothetical protein n=1 Tax=Mesorhizobium sp. M0018 TaxID=2956844 RepID=UPI00333B4F0D
MTNPAVEDLSVAVEKLGWYARRWKVEVFQKVMKSGCRADEARPEVQHVKVRLVAIAHA